MTTSVIDTLDTRYARQLSLSEVGRAGQELLARKRVAVIGAGGLGSTLLPILVGAGVGHLTLIDDDVVSVGNLPRQTLYTTEQVGESKTCCALERLRKANPHCQLTAYQERLTEENMLRTMKLRADSLITMLWSNVSLGCMLRSKDGAGRLLSSFQTLLRATQIYSPKQRSFLLRPPQ